jgi:hypothetical protein
MSITHAALAAGATLALLVSSAPPAGAQTAPAARRWELRIPSGAFVPTGSQRRVLGDAHVTAAQVSWLVRPSVAITGTFGWARSRDLGAIDKPKLDVFTSDLGVEARPTSRMGRGAVSFSPFAGVGAGMRSYNYRKLNVDATHNLAGYAAAGGEMGIGRVGVRVEARDYVAGFRPLVGTGTSVARNDVVLMAALRFNRQRSPER